MLCIVFMFTYMYWLSAGLGPWPEHKLGHIGDCDCNRMLATNLTKRVLEQRFVHVGTFIIGLDERRFARRSSTLS